jgi:EAL domain-containing protein (putative c-di-GMP-specific phosphodiesterase class I)/CheY-like chemotaxis protein
MSSLSRALKVYNEAAHSPAFSPLSAPPLNVMIVDDEEGYCNFIAAAVTELGHKAYFATSVGPALQLLMRCPPDLLFLDVGLGSHDAIDVIRGLKDLGFRGVVQLMSGDWQGLLEDVGRIGQRRGLNIRPPLHKPFRAEVVRRVIDEFPFDARQPTALQPAPPISIDLAEALARDWLELWYQPKLNLLSREFTGLEGLIRCRHPEHGVLSPGSFLPGAHPSAIGALSEYVISTALHDWHHLADVGINMLFAVNVPICDLSSARLPALVKANRPRSAMWPGLILEVTEGEVAQDIAFAHEIATQLRIYGIRLSIDDFGEGYSSFARLSELPFVELKLDGSFVRHCAQDPKKAAICRAVIELAHGFGAVAVAEGVENWADAKALQQFGCDFGQGFAFAKPMPRSLLESALVQRSYETA